MKETKYVKIIGLKFDALDGLDIVTDSNRRDIVEAAEFAKEHDDFDTFWIIVPCNCVLKG